MKLSELKPEMRARISGYEKSDREADGFVSRVMELGLTIDSEVSVSHVSPFGGAIAVLSRNGLVAIRTSDAARIMVKCE
jgi:Fe2+ transport system protein FeoA